MAARDAPRGADPADPPDVRADRPPGLEAEARRDRPDPRRRASAGRVPAPLAPREVAALAAGLGAGRRARSRGDAAARSSPSTARRGPGSRRSRARSPRGSAFPTSTPGAMYRAVGLAARGAGHRACRSRIPRPSPRIAEPVRIELATVARGQPRPARRPGRLRGDPGARDLPLRVGRLGDPGRAPAPRRASSSASAGSGGASWRAGTSGRKVFPETPRTSSS